MSLPLLRTFRFTLLLAVTLSAARVWAQPARLDELNHRVALLMDQDKWAEATPIAEEAVRVAEAIYGPEVESLVRPLRTLATLYLDQKRLRDVVAIYQRVLRIDEKALGPDDAKVASDRRFLAVIQEELRDEFGSSAAPRAPAEGSVPGEPSSNDSGTAYTKAESSTETGHPGAPNPWDTAGHRTKAKEQMEAAESAKEQEAAREQEAQREEQARESASRANEDQARQQQPSAPAAPPPAPPPPAPTDSSSGAPSGPSGATIADSGSGSSRTGSGSSNSGAATPAGSRLGGLGKSSPGAGKTTSYDFEEDTIEADLIRPDAQSSSAPPTRPIVINEVTIVDDSIERYPNIEAPETVAPGQEIAVQVSLTTEQLAPETKILSGEQHEGKLQLHMAAGEDRWTLTVNLTAPGMEFTRGGNTSEITVTRDGDSTLAIFYLRPAATALAGEPSRETRILATLLHSGAFIARLSRPLAIVSSASQPIVPAVADSMRAGPPQATSAAPMRLAAAPPVAAPAAPTATTNAKPEIRFDPDIEAPDLTIVENRVGNTLRVVFFSPHTAPVEADIADADALHAWIQSHYAQMATSARGFAPSENARAGTPQHAADYLAGFGNELYDRIAPQAFKTLFWKLMDSSTNHSPGNKRAKWRFEYIQVLSDDPAIPWELMRPARADSAERVDFLGLHFSIARWPLGTRGAARPPQSIALSQSAVIAPVYRGAQQLPSAGAELATLRQMQGFTQVAGDYASVRDLAQHPPQGIIHFAGHGAVIDQGGAPQFAILLQDSTMDPATWQSLQSTSAATHPLFFFNACDVGESRRFLNDVDGWAPVLLSSGASGYIGALWPVNDAVAEAVAASFYRRLSSHMAQFDANVAETLALARAEVFAKTGDPTALAYVFYGDPDLMVTAATSAEAH